MRRCGAAQICASVVSAMFESGCVVEVLQTQRGSRSTALRPFAENGLVGTVGKRMPMSIVAWAGTAEVVNSSTGHSGFNFHRSYRKS